MEFKEAEFTKADIKDILENVKIPKFQLEMSIDQNTYNMIISSPVKYTITYSNKFLKNLIGLPGNFNKKAHIPRIKMALAAILRGKAKLLGKSYVHHEIAARNTNVVHIGGDRALEYFYNKHGEAEIVSFLTHADRGY